MLDGLRTLFVGVFSLEVEAATIAADEPLFGPQSRFGLDSMDTLRFIAAAHRSFGLDIASARADSFRTLDGVMAVLDGRTPTEFRSAPTEGSS